jgi:hypothetical protein
LKNLLFSFVIPLGLPDIGSFHFALSG